MKVFNMFGKCMVSVAVLAVFSGSWAADNARAGNRSMMPATTMMNSAARMPVQTVTTMTVVGNPAVTTTSIPTVVSGATPSPTPTPVCPGGGVEKTEYTAEMCRNDLLNCINSGALPGGLTDMYNEEVRNSIIGGMRVCQNVVDKCRGVRENCKDVYASDYEVWMDFNCRVVQPEYYNFVLRKTGLTPNQAENTCLLLDRNAYGSSFAAVSDTNDVNTEYDKDVGAYNSAQNGSLTKNNPQGVIVNTTGYDGNRGHYARWDASKAECLVRVGAYNKDEQIKNSWLFGAVGNDNVAEVWQKTGSTFTCNKDLFGFSLLNDTKTVAVLGVGGGSVLGASVGAAAGAGAYEKKKSEFDAIENITACESEEFRNTLAKNIIKDNADKADYRGVLRNYLYSHIEFDKDNEIDESKSVAVFKSDDEFLNMDEDQCNAILNLRSKLALYKDALKECTDQKEYIINVAALVQENEFTKLLTNGCKLKGDVESVQFTYRKDCTDEQVSLIRTVATKCIFKPLKLGLMMQNSDNNALCNAHGGCQPREIIQKQVDDLEKLLKRILPNAGESPDKGKEIGKGLGIGLATGAAAGGLATMITAFLERSHITCKVGDGLNSIAFGKPYTLDSLKDFYVKWNLHLPDSAIPNGTTSNATYTNSLEAACYNFMKTR